MDLDQTLTRELQVKFLTWISFNRFIVLCLLIIKCKFLCTIIKTCTQISYLQTFNFMSAEYLVKFFILLHVFATLWGLPCPTDTCLDFCVFFVMFFRAMF